MLWTTPLENATKARFPVTAKPSAAPSARANTRASVADRNPTGADPVGSGSVMHPIANSGTRNSEAANVVRKVSASWQIRCGD
jgi:hypothetical protein